MATLELEFSVICNKCKSELTVTDEDNATKYRGSSVKVEPCETCVTEARDEGDSAGYDRGLEDGAGQAT